MTINYSNSKVYKIWSPLGDKVYIGSTTKELLCQRMTTHRYKYNQWKKKQASSNNLFITSFILFEEYGIENCFIELIEANKCASKDELTQLEGKYIREIHCINKKVEGRTIKEWCDDNKEKIKQYYQEHKEHYADRSKKYRQENKEKIKANNCKSLSCACGSIYTKMHKARHESSIKHKSYIESILKQ